MRSADVIIIGGGPGGYEVAADLARQGRKVILIERDLLGGTCLNRGCIPTKCLAASASVALTVASAAKFGIAVGDSKPDYSVAASRVESVTNQLRDGVGSMLRDVEVVHGEATLKPGPVVAVGDEELVAGKIIIATGSAPATIDIPGASYAITSDDFLKSADVPDRIAIIGGGVIGLEFASILAAFGREVAVVEYCKEILPPFDADVAKRLRLSLSRRGIKFYTSSAVKSIEPGYRVVYENRRGSGCVDCDLVIMAVGRRPVVPVGAVEAGIELDDRGFIKVDDSMQTSVGGVYAVGDVNGRCMLAHAASAQARRAAGCDVDLSIIPSAVFTEPEVAMVGLTEEQARQSGRQVIVGRSSFAANGKALAMGEADGTVKMIFDSDTGLVLGCHVIGPHASDLVAEAAALMFGKVTCNELSERLVHGHPTISEILPAAARAAR